MKANRAFRESEEAVSPVIAVILMVAITVVLAATVYVWVSGFGAQSGNPQKSISLTSSGVLSNGWKNYTVASGTSGMKYSDITIAYGGVTQALDGSGSCSAWTVSGNNLYIACAGTTLRASSSTVQAGDVISLHGLASGGTLRILDAQANAVMLTLTVG